MNLTQLLGRQARAKVPILLANQRQRLGAKRTQRREYHLNYEIWMLEETNRKQHDDQVIKNALIESFCVHARNLFEFFAEEAPQYTENYRPFSHITKRKYQDIRTKLNVHVAHVKFQGRATNVRVGDC